MPAPKLKWGLEQQVEFSEKFEKYYNDHFGFRDSLIFYQQLILYKVFKISSSEQVTVGIDDWLFFNGNAALEAYLGLIKIPQGHLEAYWWVIKDRGDWLAEKGIAYIFLPVPNKESVYPEYIPWRIRHNAGLSLYDQLMDYFTEHPGSSYYIDLKNVFLHQKKRTLLYLKTDSHWNMEGVFVAYKQIGAIAKSQHVPMTLLQKKEINWELVNYSGDLARYLHLTNCLTEVAPDINAITPCKSLPRNTVPIEQDISVFDEFINDSRKFTMVHECTENTTSVLVIHDSFGLFLKPFLNRSFATVYYVNSGFNEIKDFIEAVHPDLVIDQRVERNLLAALAPDREIEDEMVNNQFLQMKHTLLRIDRNSSASEVDFSPEVTVNFVDDGLQIRSVKPYSTLNFQYDSGEGEGAVYVQMRLSSQDETQYFLQYTTKDSSQFILQHTLMFDVSVGHNNLYFRLPDPGSVGKLQLHSGTASGEYLLHSFVVKR